MTTRLAHRTVYRFIAIGYVPSLPRGTLVINTIVYYFKTILQTSYEINVS